MVRIFITARSLEKYILKRRPDNGQRSGSTGYSIYNFMDRVSGWDSTTVSSRGCQLRNPGQEDWHRGLRAAGRHVVRNPEYGRSGGGPAQERGNGYGKQLGPRETNPYPPRTSTREPTNATNPKPRDDTCSTGLFPLPKGGS